MLPPIPNSYWIKPGRFAAGEYPGAPTTAEAAKKLRVLLTAGIDHSIDLTEQHEGLTPYAQTLASTCWGGVGRTGTTVGCWLVRHGRTGDEALAHLARLWSRVAKAHRSPRSPETAEQAKYIRGWLEPTIKVT